MKTNIHLTSITRISLIAAALCATSIPAFGFTPWRTMQMGAIHRAERIDTRTGSIVAGTPTAFILRDYDQPTTVTNTTYNGQAAQVWTVTNSAGQTQQVVVANGRVVESSNGSTLGTAAYNSARRAESIDANTGTIVVGTPARFVLNDFGQPTSWFNVTFNGQAAQQWAVTLPSGQNEQVTVANGVVVNTSF